MLAEDIWRLDNDRIGEGLAPIFVEKINNAMRLTALSHAALALGLTSGMTLADARAREPGLLVLDRDHAAGRGCWRASSPAASATPR
jgi:protein ImuB